ncbi:MAG: glycosyltransferase [Phycisphaerales bacterium]
MRILHVICTLDPRHGGPPAVAARLAAAQAALGHKVSIATFRRYHAADTYEPAERALAETPGSRAVGVHWLPDATRAERLVGTISRRRLPSIVGRAEAVHLHGVWEPMLVVAARAARRAGIPYVVRPAGMLGSWALGRRSLKKRVALALVYRRMLDRARAVQALNADEAENIRPLGLRAPVRIIPSGVFPEELEKRAGGAAGAGGAGSSAGVLPGSLAAAAGHPYILFLSRLHKAKGLDLLADAFAAVAGEFPEWHLVAAGPDFGVGPALRARVERLGLAGRFHVPGAVYGKEKGALLAGAGVFALPSEHEGFSMAIVEALARGVPVVISRECHFPEVSEVGAGIETAREAGAIAGALRAVMSDAGARERMGAAGRALVRERFTWPVVAGRCVEVYGQGPAAQG